MPTYNRRPFIAHAIRYFLRQDYQRKELIILDDGQDSIRDLVPESDMIRYYRLEERVNLGAKLNIACQYAKGDVIAHWDDDDWYAERRLQYQVDQLLTGKVEVCGINRLLYYDLRNHCAYRYVYPADQRAWLLGSSLCYTRETWSRNRFSEIDVGMDALFVSRVAPGRVKALADETISVHIIHDQNISPKRTADAWWQPYPVSEIQRIVDNDWEVYGGAESPATDRTADASARRALTTNTVKEGRPFRNVFACLVHENTSCIIDLVRNLHYHDPASVILLYNGSRDPGLLEDCEALEKFGVVVHPDAVAVEHGYLHPFALRCMEYSLAHLSFDTMTIVDSDQLCVQSRYTECLERFFSVSPNVGLLSNRPQRVRAEENEVHTAIQAFKEYELWKPFLKRFPGGEDKFVHWTFWPSTVFSAAACRDLTRLFREDTQLQEIMCKTQIWATEEIILPTLVSLLGYAIADTPFRYDFVKYRVAFTIGDMDQAVSKQDVFWVHPVPRRYEEPLRQHIRNTFGQYVRAAAAPTVLGTPATQPMHGTSAVVQTRAAGQVHCPSETASGFFRPLALIESLREIEGWLENQEADLLMAAVIKVCSNAGKAHEQAASSTGKAGGQESSGEAGEQADGAEAGRMSNIPCNIVEVGSYHGKATILMGSTARAFFPDAVITAIDPHDGLLGAVDRGITRHLPSYEKFRQNIEKARLTEMVRIIRDRSGNVKWQGPISLLLIDGLHDYPNVAADFWRFAASVTPGGYVCFHDYAEYYPGVTAFVDELVAGDQFCMAGLAGSLAVLQKK